MISCELKYINNKKLKSNWKAERGGTRMKHVNTH